ncbi:MAG: FAD:protein FMN transferase [Halieaceae bacterium]|jgi:thiamine biosynthesis lipoprotein|nr:FAD:protein FMN transferase [Halieaceae bacterium]
MILAVRQRLKCTARPAIALAFLLCLGACDSSPKKVQLKGAVFGTTWTVTYHGEPDALTDNDVEQAITGAFSVVDDSMNNYRESSTLSQLNSLPAGEVFEVDWDFALVFNTAIDIHQATAGAYDPSVSPLINLWGFGPEGVTESPKDEQLAIAKSHSGLNQFAWDLSDRSFLKRNTRATLDLSSIAKGYAVDLAGDALDEIGVANFMLEVGGEIQTRGVSPRGDHWRLAIENPIRAGVGKPYAAVAVSNVGIATSGNYRNFFEVDGKRFSHLIDPRTGYPIEHDLVSATVIHPSTMVADAWATALMVVGTTEALRLANLYDLSVYLISRNGEQLISSHNQGMSRWLIASDNGETTP